MKRLLLTITAASLFLASCQDAPKADSAEASEAQEVSNVEGTEYTANTDQTVVEWIGTKPVGTHHGTVKVQNGTLIVSGDQLTGGSFVMDIKSLSSDDQNDEYNAKLTGHLLSEDFFKAEEFPTGKFEITGVTAGVEQTEDLVMKDATHMVTGNLTLKDVTKSITFPAKVVMGEGNIIADANFNIDRTQFGMVYGNDESLGDKFIRPTVNLQVHLVAEHQM
ncbi:MAG: YceI family protein [Flavipsychrobacter sp.]